MERSFEYYKELRKKYATMNYAYLDTVIDDWEEERKKYLKSNVANTELKE